MTENDLTNEVGDLLLGNLGIKNMNNGIGALSKENIKSALVYGLLFGIFAILDGIITTGSIFNIDWKLLVNSGIIAGLGTTVSLIKNLLTTNKGNFVGTIKVIPPIE